MSAPRLRGCALVSRALLPRSYLGKVFLLAFVGTHVPLAALAAYLVLAARPAFAPAVAVLLVALGATLVGSAATLLGLWLLLALPTSLLLPGASYLFLWPLAFGLLGLAAVLAWPTPDARAGAALLAAALPGVVLLDLADLRAFVDAGIDSRRAEMVKVRSVVAEELARYTAELAAREVAPTVTALRERAEAVRAGELERHRSRLAGLDARQQEAVEAATRGIVAKLLHEPTVRLKDAGGSPRGERLSGALRELFDL